jgi:hypothetical protein
MRTRLVKVTAGAVLIAALAGGGVAWATAGDDEGNVTGPAADRARAAALAHVGSGKATEVEREGSSWEVEVQRADGSTLEVHLDSAYEVVGSETDSEDADGSEQEDE